MISRQHVADSGKSGKKRLWLILPVALALIVSACSSPAPPLPAAPPAPVSSPTASPEPTSPPLPSPSPKPELTMSPTPLATPKPSPPATPKPATTTAVTPTPSPSPSPSTVAPPPLTPAPTPVYTYTENFTKPGGWPTKSTKPDLYEVGYAAAGQPPGYYLTIKVPNYSLFTLDVFFGDTFDFIIQVDCTALTDLTGLYGIGFRMDQQTNDRYEFAVAYTTGTYSLSKLVGGKRSYLIPWKTSPLVKKGANQANRLMVDAVGNQFTLYANGYLLDRFTDTDSLRLGVLRVFGASAGSPDVRFVFNNFGMTSK